MSLLFLLLLLCLCQLPTSIASITEVNKPFFEGSEHEFAGNEGGQLTVLLPNANNEDMRHNVSCYDYNFVNSQNVFLGTYGRLVGTCGDYFGASTQATIICKYSTDTLAMIEFVGMFEDTFWNAAPDQNVVHDTQDYAGVERNFVDYLRIVQQFFEDEFNAVDEIPDQVYVVAATYPTIYVPGDLITVEQYNAQKQISPGLQAIPARPYMAYRALGDTRFATQMGAEVFLAFGKFLLYYNLDHFSDCAIRAYTVAHAAAQNEARTWGSYLRSSNLMSLSLYDRGAVLNATQRGLDKAYSMNAWADHFLTDLFSAGHVRTPREQIRTVCDLQESNAAIAARAMHDEDNRNGLWVTNHRGDIWKTFGDDMFFDPDNARTREIVEEAEQTSRDEVYAAFDSAASSAPSGTQGTFNSWGALELIPDSHNMTQFDAINPCPYFITQGADVYFRHSGTNRPPSWNNTDTSAATTCNFTEQYELINPNGCPLGEAGSAVEQLEQYLEGAPPPYLQQFVYAPDETPMNWTWRYVGLENSFNTTTSLLLLWKLAAIILGLCAFIICILAWCWFKFYRGVKKEVRRLTRSSRGESADHDGRRDARDARDAEEKKGKRLHASSKSSRGSRSEGSGSAAGGEQELTTLSIDISGSGGSSSSTAKQSTKSPKDKVTLLSSGTRSSEMVSDGLGSEGEHKHQSPRQRVSDGHTIQPYETSAGVSLSVPSSSSSPHVRRVSNAPSSTSDPSLNASSLRLIDQYLTLRSASPPPQPATIRSPVRHDRKLSLTHSETPTSPSASVASLTLSTQPVMSAAPVASPEPTVPVAEIPADVPVPAPVPVAEQQHRRSSPRESESVTIPAELRPSESEPRPSEPEIAQEERPSEPGPQNESSD